MPQAGRITLSTREAGHQEGPQGSEKAARVGKAGTDYTGTGGTGSMELVGTEGQQETLGNRGTYQN